MKHLSLTLLILTLIGCGSEVASTRAEILDIDAWYLDDAASYPPDAGPIEFYPYDVPFVSSCTDPRDENGTLELTRRAGTCAESISKDWPGCVTEYDFDGIHCTVQATLECDGLALYVTLDHDSGVWTGGAQLSHDDGVCGCSGSYEARLVL